MRIFLPLFTRLRFWKVSIALLMCLLIMLLYILLCFYNILCLEMSLTIRIYRMKNIRMSIFLRFHFYTNVDISNTRDLITNSLSQENNFSYLSRFYDNWEAANIDVTLSLKDVIKIESAFVFRRRFFVSFLITFNEQL